MMAAMKPCFTLCLIWLNIQVNVCLITPTYQDAVVLSNSLLQNYSRHLRPVLNQSSPVSVKANFVLKSISNFDEMEGTLKVVGGLHLYWRDEILRWNPFDNGNMISISLPISSVWHPIFYLVNSAYNMDISSDLESCTYQHTGEAAASHGFIVSSLCSPNTRFYPYDAHECILKFTTFTSKLHSDLITDGILMNEFEENSKWEILNPRAEIGIVGRYPSVDLKMTIQRRASFLMLTFVLPIVLLGLMNLVVFVLSNNSGERISFSVTVLLSFAVFITIISDKMPHTSTNLSIFCVYLLAALIYSSIIVVATVISVNIYNVQDFEQLPKILRAFTIYQLKRARKIGQISNEEMINNASFTKECVSVSVKEHIWGPQDLSDQCKIRKAGQLSDIFFLTIFVTVYLLGTTVFLVVIGS